jgi:hypothetical protein
MKSGKLAQVHREEIKAECHDQCFKEAEQSSKELQLWTSIAATPRSTGDSISECATVDNATCG